MEIIALDLPDLKLLRPTVFRDGRGFFVETYVEPRYRTLGIEVQFVQDNHSRSAQGTLRGLHFQSDPGQAKLIRVASGRVYDVAVDIRPDSPTFGRWQGVYLDAESQLQLFIPAGFAHGFCAMSETADVVYKVSSLYDPDTERSIRWDDPDLAITWPVTDPVLSARDRSAGSFADYVRLVRNEGAAP